MGLGKTGAALLALFVIAAPALADTTQEVVNKAPNGLALTPPMGWNSWNKFACNVERAADSRDGGRDGRERHARRRLSVRGHRRLLARRARLPRLHSSPIPQRFRRASRRWRITCTQGPQVRHLLGRRRQDLRRAPRQPGTRVPGCADVRPVGRRLPQVRLVQHRLRARRRSVPARWRRAPRQRGRPMVFSMCEWGPPSRGCGRRPRGNLWRTTGDISD